LTFGRTGRLITRVKRKAVNTIPCPIAGKIAMILLQGFFQNLRGILALRDVKIKLINASVTPATKRKPNAFASDRGMEKPFCSKVDANEYPKSAASSEKRKPKKSAKTSQKPSLQESDKK
jgi:hypothetical protein